MPYYLHASDVDAILGTMFHSKDIALAARQHGEIMTFVPTEAEKRAWMTREQQRFDNCTYVQTPWHDHTLWYDEEQTQAKLMRYHYAHVSLDSPGMIAYTPNDTYGHEDRQLRVKPGKYLEQFGLLLFSGDQRAEFIGGIKCYHEEIKLATTADDIVRVYCAEGGPSSCMDGRNFDRDNSPVQVYGDSDLAVAYLGILSGDGPSYDEIKARCVVWPEKKIYTRVYGDLAVMNVGLAKAGYTKGNIDGAKIRAIKHGSSSCGTKYVMPYIDDVDMAQLSRDKKWFVLGDGDYNTKYASGYTGEASTCENCGEECDEDEMYCSSCNDSRWSCDSCGETYWENDSAYSHNYATLCESCNDEHNHTCQACDTTFNDFDFSMRVRRSRNDDLCGDCHDTHVACTSCGDYVTEVNDEELCKDCTPEPEEDEKESVTVLRVHSCDAPRERV